MPQCNNCGAELMPTTAKFCSECGQDQRILVPQDKNNQIDAAPAEHDAPRESFLDVLAKSAATGTITRRRSLGLMGGTFLGGVLASIPGLAWAQSYCPPPTTLCGSSCKDLRYDTSNCGRCGNVCPANSYCQNGVCREAVSGGGSGGGSGSGVCPSGQSPCFCCTGLSSDRNNCGACGNRCSSSQTCQNGVCTDVTCPPGRTPCPTRDGVICVDTNTNGANCGACGNSCNPSGPSEGITCCAGRCVDTGSDNNNCGRCGNVCSTGTTCRPEGGPPGTNFGICNCTEGAECNGPGSQCYHSAESFPAPPYVCACSSSSCVDDCSQCTGGMVCVSDGTCAPSGIRCVTPC
jgi:Stigma-specific protein, Stig1